MKKEKPKTENEQDIKTQMELIWRGPLLDAIKINKFTIYKQWGDTFPRVIKTKTDYFQQEQTND